MVENVLHDRDQPIVLVVDDDVTLRILVRESLEPSGFFVEEATDGAEAISLFRNLRPDIVLLDVMMPEMDGFTTCSELHKLRGDEQIPVVMMTSLDDTDSINRAYEVGATDFITKPINWAILPHRLRYILRASKAFNDLKRSEAKNQALLEAIPDMLFQIDRDGTLLEIKGARENRFTAIPNEFIGRKIGEVMPSEAAQAIMVHLEKAIVTREVQVFEYRDSIEGNTRFFEGRLVASGEEKVLAIIRDVTEHRLAEEQIFFLAYHDTLTHLPNRHLLKDRMRQALAYAQRHNLLVAILFLDLDNFKRINDTLGHNTGDLLLQGVGDRLVKCVRRSDTVARAGMERLEPTVARLGGDEFTVLLNGILSIQNAAKVAQRILDMLSQPFILGPHEVVITASIGITVFPIDSEDVETLLKNADTAMYQAKEQGKNNYQFYAESMNAVALERFTMENQLRKALKNQEFRLNYQPQMDLRTGKIVGVESVLRWVQPDRGSVQPEAFIPLAEDTGLILPIGEWVLQTACAETQGLRRNGFSSLSLTVNISSLQLRQKEFAQTVIQVVKASDMDPHHLELELTESIIMQNIEATVPKLQGLKDIGIQLSLDDFGTGYSSLSYLERIPLDTIKIDRSFINDIFRRPNCASIVKAIIAMAHSLNLKVVAEGVETEDQLAFLMENGCDQAQGYFISEPLPRDALIDLLDEWKSLDLKMFR
ncbi:MAG: EAL domain-containing protein [Syntrophaceae bacterium]|nr:EAL domain-containing protein [Syntrophaceae bacterium]